MNDDGYKLPLYVHLIFALSFDVNVGNNIRRKQMHNRIALIGDNSIEYVDKLIDIWNRGDCAVLIDWRIPLTKAIEMMREANVSSCYIDSRLLNTDENTQTASHSDIEFILYDSTMKNTAVLLPDSIYNKFNDNYSSDEAVIIYSSGTTGKAKGIILSHYAIHTNANAIIDYMKPIQEDRIYIMRTICHSSVITGELLVALKKKILLLIAPIIVPPRIILSNISKFKITIICLNPTLLDIVSEEITRKTYDISSLRTVYVSGSILSDRIYNKKHNFTNIPVYNVYGLTEAGPRVTAQRINCCKSNSVGKPIKGVDVVIVDKNGKLLPSNHRGIVHVRTPSLFSDYVSGARKISLHDPEWLNTGDIGFFDEYGELHIVGRSDDLIIIDSYKVYPNDIEHEILKCYGVRECVVTKTEYEGKDVLVCLYTGNKMSENDIIKKIRNQLTIHEIPRRFIWIESIPRTMTGKISIIDVKNIIKIKMEASNDRNGN